MSDYFVQEACVDSDKNDILKLWHESFPKTRYFEHKYNWLYKKNIYKNSQLYVLIHGKSQQRVGIQGISARCFEFHGEVISTGLVGDFAVSKDHRTLGPGLKLLKSTMTAALSDNDFIYSFPNTKAVPVVKRSGYKLHKNINRYVKIIKSFHYLEQILPKVVSLFLAPLIDGSIYIVDGMRFTFYRNSINYEFRKDMNVAINDLWDKAGYKNNCLLQRRNKNYIDWREKECTSAKVNYFIIKKNGGIVGYIAYILDNKLKTILIVDFFALDQEKYTRILFSMFVFNVRRNNIVSISVEYTGTECIDSSVRSTGFRLRDSRPVFYKFNKTSVFNEKEPEIFLTAWDEDAV